MTSVNWRLSRFADKTNGPDVAHAMSDTRWERLGSVGPQRGPCSRLRARPPTVVSICCDDFETISWPESRSDVETRRDRLVPSSTSNVSCRTSTQVETLDSEWRRFAFSSFSAIDCSHCPMDRRNLWLDQPHFAHRPIHNLTIVCDLHIHAHILTG